MSEPAFDEIGYWSEIKLDIVREYASAYSQILSSQQKPRLHHVYIDGFAGRGKHISKSSGDFVPGSPLNALNITPRFREYFLVDLNSDKVDSLKEITAEIPDVHIYAGDCNTILLDEVFPQVRYQDFKRGLCLLDPYGLHLNWDVILAAGQSRSIEMFLNFPVMDMNMNILWHNFDAVSPKQMARMNAFWGDDSWRRAVYTTETNLFGFEEKRVDGNDAIVDAFRKRLINVAGFAEVPGPIPMRNTIGRTVYYLFFATHKQVAAKIVRDIFDKYRNRGLG
jgi:three-Cys-motif partner protein